jgi:hypothetical protein
LSRRSFSEVGSLKGEGGTPETLGLLQHVVRKNGIGPN